MEIDINTIQSAIGLCTFIVGLLIAALSIYWLYYVYKINFEVQRIYLIQQYCGTDVMEKETLRYQLKQGALNEMFSTFQQTVIVSSIIGLIVTILGFGFLLLLKSRGGTTDANSYFQLTMFILVFLLFLLLIRSYDGKITDTQYNEKWNDVKKSLDIVLGKFYVQNDINEYFIKNKLATFSPHFVKELVQRIRNEKYLLANKDPRVEMIYSDSGIITSLENELFPQENGVITIKTEKFLELLRPEKNLDPTTNVRKLDLDYIDEAYRTWACQNTSMGADIICQTTPYIIHLPELSNYNSYPVLKSMLRKYTILGWLLFTLMMYTFYHQYYTQDRFILMMIFVVVILLITITMYYLMAVRYDL